MEPDRWKYELYTLLSFLEERFKPALTVEKKPEIIDEPFAPSWYITKEVIVEAYIDPSQFSDSQLALLLRAKLESDLNRQHLLLGEMISLSSGADSELAEQSLKELLQTHGELEQLELGFRYRS